MRSLKDCNEMDGGFLTVFCNSLTPPPPSHTLTQTYTPKTQNTPDHLPPANQYPLIPCSPTSFAPLRRRHRTRLPNHRTPLCITLHRQLIPARPRHDAQELEELRGSDVVDGAWDIAQPPGGGEDGPIVVDHEVEFLVLACFCGEKGRMLVG